MLVNTKTINLDVMFMSFVQFVSAGGFRDERICSSQLGFGLNNIIYDILY